MAQPPRRKRARSDPADEGDQDDRVPLKFPSGSYYCVACSVFTPGRARKHHSTCPRVGGEPPMQEWLKPISKADYEKLNLGVIFQHQEVVGSAGPADGAAVVAGRREEPGG